MDQERNGYISLSTFVTTLVGVTFALASLGASFIFLSQADIRQKLEAHEKRLDHHDDLIVPWQVHLEKWNAQKAQDDRLQQEIDELNKRLGDAYTLKDEFDNLNSRLGRLEDGKIEKKL